MQTIFLQLIGLSGFQYPSVVLSFIWVSLPCTLASLLHKKQAICFNDIFCFVCHSMETWRKVS